MFCVKDKWVIQEVQVYRSYVVSVIIVGVTPAPALVTTCVKNDRKAIESSTMKWKCNEM